MRVRGESALRFDVGTLTLHAFGAELWVDELFGLLALTLALLFGFLLVTLLFGRVWCGWACPQTALADLTAPLERARARGGVRGALALGAAAVASALVAADLLWYFVPPQEFVARAVGHSLGPALGGAWAVLSAATFANVVAVRQRFCATACPYAKLQGALLDRHSMIVAYDQRRAADCVDCGACVRACPVHIDIRHGLQAACIACAECVDACRPIMRKLGRAPGLVGYFFGAPGTPRRLARPAAWALGALASLSLALLVATAAARTPLEVTVSSDPGFSPRRGAAGELHNAFTVALENRGRAPLAVALALSAPGVGEVRVRPDALTLAPREHRRVRLVATANAGAGPRAIPGELVVRAGGRAPARRALTLAVPAEAR